MKILDVQPPKDSPAYGARNVSDGGGGNWRGPPRPGDLRMVLPERRAL